jgi:short-subunit dehydrogenase
MHMPISINEAVVVITGASSGIGKATAIAFAREGASLALCARRQPELEQTAAECRRAGARVETMVVDVSRAQEVEALAQRAIDTFGRIDIWINNAGTDSFGTFSDMPIEAIERCLHVNLFGTIYGMKAALPHFISQGEGVIINNASLVGIVPTPFHSAYVASKFAIRGLSHSVRQELMAHPGIHVCTVCPSSIDTPLWQRAANYSGRKVKPLDPVHPVEQVAAVMLGLARSPRREVFAGATGWILAEQHNADPEVTETLAAGIAQLSLFQVEPAEPTAGSLFTAEDHEGGASGGWMLPGTPGLPFGDLLGVAMAPALAMMPAMFSFQIGRQFVEQWGRQLPALATPAAEISVPEQRPTGF